jgi:phage baseplate assembly protein gpV
MEQSIAVTSSTGQKLTLDQKGIVLDAGKGAAKVTLSTSGTISIEASTKVELKAQSISVEGTNVDVKASAAGTVDGGGALTVKGGIVRIN